MSAFAHLPGRGPTPRSPVRETPLAHHGAYDYEELGALAIDPETLLDFSVNSNPYGPSPQVYPALAQVPLDRYPDRQCLALRRALAEHHGVSLEQIVVGNGTAELLWSIATAFVRPPGPRGSARYRVLILGPTFGEYHRSVRLMGADTHEYRAAAEDDFVPDASAISRRLIEARPQIVCLCHPNNPTGALYNLDALSVWVRDNPDTLFVVDEAYIAFTQGAPSALALDAGNVLVLRSMTKDYALAGLRLGYAVGPARLVDALARVRPAWNVNALAQAAGTAALRDQPHLTHTLAALARSAARLSAGLRDLGLHTVPSATHYRLVAVGHGAAFRTALMGHGILVRDCASFGLANHVRIATRRPEENERLLQAIALLHR